MDDCQVIHDVYGIRKYKGYIYKIYSMKNPEHVYIGSTRASLRNRLNGHIDSYKRWLKYQKWMHMNSKERAAFPEMRTSPKSYMASFEIFQKYGIDDDIRIDKVDSLYSVHNSELLQLEGMNQLYYKEDKKYYCCNIVSNRVAAVHQDPETAKLHWGDVSKNTKVSKNKFMEYAFKM